MKRKWMTTIFGGLLLWAVVVAPPAAAQRASYEITPYYGYSLLRSVVDVDTVDTGVESLVLELDETSVLGAVVGFPLRRNLHLELWFNEQSLDFGFDGARLADLRNADSRLDGRESVDALLPVLENAGSLDLSYIHAGLAWSRADRDKVRPFFTLSAGITELDLGLNRQLDRLVANLPADLRQLLPEDLSFREFGLQMDNLPSLGLGGGVKIYWTDRFGLRLEARLLATKVDDDDLCYYRNYCYEVDEGALFDGIATAGFIFAF